jgi:hypothetical protein
MGLALSGDAGFFPGWFTGSVVSAGFALSQAMAVENFPLIPCCQ